MISQSISFLASGSVTTAISIVVTLLALFAGVVVRFIVVTQRREQAWPQFPMISVRGETPKRSFSLYGQETLKLGLEQCGGGPFQVMCGSGPVIMLANKFADEIRNDSRLEFYRGVKQDFFPEYPGFEPFKEGLEPGSVSMEAIHKKLTPSLGLVTPDLIAETTSALHDVYGEQPDWQAVSARDSTLDVVARVSSRVFLGEDLCRNDRWLQIAKTYVIHAFTGAFLLRLVPSLFRPVKYWFMPQLKLLRQTVADARRLIDVELAKQMAVTHKALEENQTPPKTTNTLRWMYELSLPRRKRVDFTAAQLAFTVVAMATQSALHAQAILNICERPDLATKLREEIINVVSQHGWRNASLQKLELMDSYIKEIQRLHPANTASMNRYVVEDILLSDGSILPQGARIQVMSDHMNPEVYEDPETFVPDRYLKMRRKDPASSAKWQLTTPHATNMGFGFGRNSCPGRFFAVHQIKITLSHMLMKYDWRFVEGAETAQYDFEDTVRRLKKGFMVEYRRRREEIDLDLYL